MASALTDRTSSRLDDLVSTAPGTPAGTYLRTFWNPIYHSVDLKVGRPVPLRIMSESFTLYRVEGDALRCFYHGWKFESDGRCSEQPADESKFCDRVSIRSWPVKEHLGLIFAYLGDGSLPEFPTYPEFERFAGLL